MSMFEDIYMEEKTLDELLQQLKEAEKEYEKKIENLDIKKFEKESKQWEM